MNSNQLRQIYLEIQNNLRCTQCGRAYVAKNIHLRGTLKNIYFFQLNCEGHSAFATITVLGQQINMSTENVSTDDLLALHEQLTNFNGNFKKVFKKT
jgi:hypothetical protein